MTKRLSGDDCLRGRAGIRPVGLRWRRRRWRVRRSRRHPLARLRPPLRLPPQPPRRRPRRPRRPRRRRRRARITTRPNIARPTMPSRPMRSPPTTPGATGKGIKIGIVDSGINPDLAEFAGRIDPASGDVAGNRGVSDEGGHGTAVSAVAAAARNNQNTMGVAFDATIVSERADQPGSCATDRRLQLLRRWHCRRHRRCAHCRREGDQPLARRLDARAQLCWRRCSGRSTPGS